MDEKKDDHKIEHKENTSEHQHHHVQSHHFEHHDHVKRKIKFDNVIIAISAILAILLIFTIFTSFGISSALKKNIVDANEKSRPGRIDLLVIKDSKCADCFEIDMVSSAIKSTGVNVTSETAYDLSSREAKNLMSKYDIQKIPTIILTGEIDKVAVQGLEKKDDALILLDVPAPFTNASTSKIQGLVTAYMLEDPECKQCANLSLLLEQIKAAGMKTGSERKVALNSQEGRNLINQYKITISPSLVLSSDASLYPMIKQAWQQVGSIEQDGSFVLRLAYPPFVNLSTGDLRGLVSVTYLADKSCTECYDVGQHRTILTSPSSFGFKFEKEQNVDLSDATGKELVAKYNISQVPTVILTGDVSSYPAAAALTQFFSKEKDGSYVFRTLSVVGNYKDLTTGEIVKPQEQ